MFDSKHRQFDDHEQPSVLDAILSKLFVYQNATGKKHGVGAVLVNQPVKPSRLAQLAILQDVETPRQALLEQLRPWRQQVKEPLSR